jgi:hypothetical protein
MQSKGADSMPLQQRRLVPSFFSGIVKKFDDDRRVAGSSDQIAYAIAVTVFPCCSC